MWTFLYFVLLPTILIFGLPIYFYRGVISQLRKILRPDLDKLVNTRSSVLAREDWTKNPQWNLVIWLTHEGLLDFEKFRKDFYNDYVMQEDDNGNLKFPEYQQHYYKWMGFLFWRWEDVFDMREHVRTYDGDHQASVVDKSRFLQIVKELTWKPWQARKSPWEFLQVAHYDDGSGDGVEKSQFIFRIHHGLGDGYYILKLLAEDICGVSTALGKPQVIPRNFFQNIFLGFLFWIRAPFQMVQMLVAAHDVNEWHLPLDKVTRPMNIALTEPIKLDWIKSIKNEYCVSFSAVIYAAVTGGIRNLMIEKGVPVPNEMHTAVAVPVPGHPPKLRNHFIFAFIELPIGISDPVERLQKMEINYINLKRSAAPKASFAKVPLVGALPPWMMSPGCVNRLSTCLVSNFPGSPQLYFKGIRVS
ncbi:unnamed protein product, partial [Allacma fusca]